MSRSLRELWDKVPASYRRMVIEYYRDITEPEEANERPPPAGEPRE